MDNLKRYGRAGFTKIATRIGLKRLSDANMVSVKSYSESMNEGSYYGYTVTDLGAKYILNNQDKVELRRKSKSRTLETPQVPNDDIPF
jgi:hypothetical protein